ncbi:CheR family methyltransferase [Salirhabdus salicampi]|uniref:CheR family methyltransferase n=1 Tax=Salirhabdus salicampi TaxID=476102 RepID=UPI0020C2E4A3|nr:protein-glutamate O-methyltransferase CheR [Salirhabdus salicampi]MCP8616700.1 protein-glutamate O-methyltransferase CheR [Salirhabdus salicampi]
MNGDYDRFINNIYEKSNINLRLYKQTQMFRRLTTLRDKRGYHTFGDYYRAMLQDEELYEEFLNRITINVSDFFRNQRRWEVLKQNVFPRLAKNSQRIKVWSAACAAGEEPYSLAMIADHSGILKRTSVLATDLDQAVLARAREGVYTNKSLRELPLPFKEKYFEQLGDRYYVLPKLKKRVTFKRHNLLEDDYEQGFDLIVCRNVFIYFTDEAKHIIYKQFSKALRSGGVLFVGSTEQIVNPQRYNLKPTETFFYEKC